MPDKHSYVSLIPKKYLRCGKIEANSFLLFQRSFFAPKFWGHSKTHFDDPKYLEWAKLNQYSSVSSWKRWWGPFWLTNILRGLYRPPKWPKNTHKTPQNSYFEAKPEQWCSQILLSVLQWPSIVVFNGKNDGGVHFSKKKYFLGTLHRRKIPPKTSSKCLFLANSVSQFQYHLRGLDQSDHYCRGFSSPEKKPVTGLFFSC